MDAETWRWIWLTAAAAFLVGEIVTTGFFLLPFGVGAAVAAVCGFAGVDVEIQWVVFVAVSAVGFFSLRPFARRLDDAIATEGVGSKRLIGELATVLEPIEAGPDGTGRIRVQREEWRAVSSAGEPIAEGATVQIIDMRGTRAVVRVVDTTEGSPS